MLIFWKLLTALNWKRVLTLGIPLGLSLILLILTAQNKSLETRLAELRNKNSQMEETLVAVKLAAQDAEKKHAAAITALEQSIREERVRVTKIAAIKKEISNAKPEEDAPVAPVLSRTLDRLRELGQ